MSSRGASGTSWTCRMTATNEQYVKCALIMKNTTSAVAAQDGARGLWRTNAVEFQGVGYVYERLSRVNRLRARRELRARLRRGTVALVAAIHQGGRRAAPGLW